MHRTMQVGVGSFAERGGEARPGASRGSFVAVDRERHDARMAEFEQPVNQLDGFARGLLTQQTDAQPDRRKTVLFRLPEPDVQRLHEGVQAVAPGGPVGGIEDQIGVADSGAGFAFGKGVGGAGNLLGRAHQAAGPVQELEELGEVHPGDVGWAR